MKLQIYKKTITILISLVVTLIITEIFLRFFIIKPWEYLKIEDPSINKDHTVLGWKAKEGVYNFSAMHKTGNNFRLKIKKNGNRENGDSDINTVNEILLIGGSFTQGWGVNDNETFSFKLQKKYKNYKIYNFGQAGYGSIQSYLLLKEQLAKIKSPKYIIYGIIQHHEYRNIAHEGWLRMLSQYSSRGSVYTPYGSLSKNKKLIIHSPIGYSTLPFREKLSLVTLVEKVYNKVKSKKRVYIKLETGKKIKQQVIVTKETIARMKEISKKIDSNFIVVNLDWKGSFRISEYKNFFEKNKIKFVNCAVPLDKKFAIPGDYHVNKEAHTFYKNCLVNYFDKQNLL